ncbi:MAG: hypothetical protein M0Z39_11220 [Actinomycetota bacterium]|jgi:hypothetical protein|nr:hypothetical protein [Actinomycetota bacterium]
MSITSELTNPESAASLWLAENFDLDPAISALTAQAEGVATIRPSGTLKDYPWATVGHAVEFRLRQSCGVAYYKTTAPLGNEHLFQGYMLNDALAVLWDEHETEQWTSKENAWVLCFAGLSEGRFRSRRKEGFKCYEDALVELGRLHDWKMFGVEMDLLRQGKVESVSAKEHACLGLLMELMPVADAVLSDVAAVSDAAIASDGFQKMKLSGSFIDNPVFSGGKWVGGADGDFIFGRTLYDVKTTIRPENLWPSAVRQVISYMALDAIDEYRIEELAVFLPRQHGLVAKVSLGEILEHSTFSSRVKMQESLRRALGR